MLAAGWLPIYRGKRAKELLRVRWSCWKIQTKVFRFQKSHFFSFCQQSIFCRVAFSFSNQSIVMFANCLQWTRQKDWNSLIILTDNQQDGYVCYDWFVSSVFLIMMGNREKTLTFLHQFSYLLVSAFLWAPRLHNSVRFWKKLNLDKLLWAFLVNAY